MRERWSSSTLGTLWLHSLVLGMAPSIARSPKRSREQYLPRRRTPQIGTTSGLAEINSVAGAELPE